MFYLYIQFAEIDCSCYYANDYMYMLFLSYRFLEESKELFTMEYDAAPPEYHRRLA